MFFNVISLKDYSILNKIIALYSEISYVCTKEYMTIIRSISIKVEL
jgi:hypothetical protein